MTDAAPLLELRDVRAGYGPVDVLHGISLEVRRGEIVSLIGANGAGKSSTLMCISRINPLRGGSIRFDGADITGERADRLVPRGSPRCPRADGSSRG